MVQRGLLTQVIWVLRKTTILWSQAIAGRTLVVGMIEMVPTLLTVYYVPIHSEILTPQHIMLQLHIPRINCLLEAAHCFQKTHLTLQFPKQTHCFQLCSHRRQGRLTMQPGLCQEIGLVAIMFFFELLFSYASSQFPSMFSLLTYSQSFFFLICQSPETLKTKEKQEFDSTNTGNSLKVNFMT